MANLLHENKKMNVFEALNILEALESKYNFVAGESVSTANVIIFLPKNDGRDTDDYDGNDVIYFFVILIYYYVAKKENKYT